MDKEQAEAILGMMKSLQSAVGDINRKLDILMSGAPSHVENSDRMVQEMQEMALERAKENDSSQQHGKPSFKNLSIDSSTTSLISAKTEKPQACPPMKKSETSVSSMSAIKRAAKNASKLFSLQKPTRVDPEEFIPTDQSKPLHPLPPLMDEKTGEENEDTVLISNCKLYRFDPDSNVHKERGVGEIKILRNKETGRHRCIMRRESTLTICIHFSIVKGLEAKIKGTKPHVILWACRDYSENMALGSDEIFSARFRDEQTATDFCQKMNNIADSL